MAKPKLRPAAKRRRPGKPRKTATKSRAQKVELKHVPWHTVDLEDLNPLLQRQFVVGNNTALRNDNCFGVFKLHHYRFVRQVAPFRLGWPARRSMRRFERTELMLKGSV